MGFAHCLRKVMVIGKYTKICKEEGDFFRGWEEDGLSGRIVPQRNFSWSKGISWRVIKLILLRIIKKKKNSAALSLLSKCFVIYFSSFIPKN